MRTDWTQNQCRGLLIGWYWARLLSQLKRGNQTRTWSQWDSTMIRILNPKLQRNFYSWNSLWNPNVFSQLDINDLNFRFLHFRSDSNDRRDRIKLSKIGFNDTFLVFIDGLIEVPCESELSIVAHGWLGEQVTGDNRVTIDVWQRECAPFMSMRTTQGPPCVANTKYRA